MHRTKVVTLVGFHQNLVLNFHITTTIHCVLEYLYKDNPFFGQFSVLALIRLGTRLPIPSFSDLLVICYMLSLKKKEKVVFHKN